MDWKNTGAFETKGQVLIQEIYKGHEISVATDHNGHHPGIKVWEAKEGKLTKAGSNPHDLTDCFAGVDAGHEIPFSMAALREVFEQIDTWEMANKAQGMAEADDHPLGRVMLVRCLQAYIERTMQKGEVDPAWCNLVAIRLEQMLWQ